MVWIWIIFGFSAIGVFVDGVKLSKYGEAIAVSTKLGGRWADVNARDNTKSTPLLLCAGNLLNRYKRFRWFIEF